MGKTPRYDHACAHYMDSQDRAVLLVTGGSDGDNSLDSTELLLPSATSWTTIHSAALPSPRRWPRGATLDNKVLVTGGYYYDDSTNTWTTYNDVLEYDEEEQVWNKIGTLTMKRRRHAVSVINYNSIK